MNNKAIGIFDSGVGGLTVMRSVRDVLPNERIIYVADSANAPYGEKSQSFIEKRSFEITDFLLKRGAKLIVVACNTATVSAVQKLRNHFNIPIVAVEPGIKPAVLMSQTQKIGVLATEKTVKSQAFVDLIFRFSDQTTIIPQACPGLVELIEKTQLDTPSTLLLLEKLVAPLLDQGVDTLVLGCTHYAFVLLALRRLVGDDVNIITTHDAVAKQVVTRLDVERLNTQSTVIASECFFTNKQEVIDCKLIDQLWRKKADVQFLS